MGEALRVDELWEPTTDADAGASPHLETNKWLAPVFGTAPQRAPRRKAPLEIPFLGHTILWTADRDRPFPAWLVESLGQLLMFSALPPGWDSYGGRPMQQPAVGPVLRLIFHIHDMGRQGRLVPLPDGGVGIRLEAEGRSLEIDIDSLGRTEAILELSGADDVVIGPEAPVVAAEQILDQFLLA